MQLCLYDARRFDRGASRVKEALWWLVRGLFFLPSWPVPSRLRALFLRAFGACVGRGVVIRSGVNITFPWRLKIRDHVWIGEDVLILSLAPVTIESNVCVSQRAFLCTGSHDYQREDFALITRPITIRSGSWIAAQAFIGPGVEIGSGAVVSAGSVVLKNVPANAFVRGNPAELVKWIEAREVLPVPTPRPEPVS